MPERGSYHHGDLRKALLQAGAEVLQETGIDKFSLRKVARKVGVSHSAPAHHFTDSNGLLMAIAADGFRNLLRLMETEYDKRADDLREAIFGSALGYIAFAVSAPVTFRLMFGQISDCDVPQDTQEAGRAAFEHLASNIEKLLGKSRSEDPAIMADILAAWSVVHGFSDLLTSGGLPDFEARTPDEQNAFFRSIFLRVLP